MTIVRVSGTVNNIPKGSASTNIPSGSYTVNAGTTATINAAGPINLNAVSSSTINVRSTLTTILSTVTSETSLSTVLYFNDTNGILPGFKVSGNNIDPLSVVDTVVTNTYVTITLPALDVIPVNEIVTFKDPGYDAGTDLSIYTSRMKVYGTDSTTTIEGQLVVGPHITIDNSSTTFSSIIINSTGTANVGNPLGVEYTNTNVYDTTTNRTIGSVYIPGGLGVEKDLNVGGYIYGRVAQATSSTLLIVSNTNVDQVFYPIFVDDIRGITASQLYGNSATADDPLTGLTYNPSTGLLKLEKLNVASTANTTSTTTGAVLVGGGISVGADIGITGNIIPRGVRVTDLLTGKTEPTSSLGTSTQHFYQAYVDNLYSSVLQSVNTGTDYEKNVNLVPQPNHWVDIYGDIRVRGSKPIGTAPVVTNVLWVTVDGDDTNDGRAEDSSRACRTISGAIKSPYYQPGTQIRVRAGHYLEDNPIELKPYTSVMGSDLRTTSIEPINKTQDLFHVQSGCYIAFAQMTNGRSGLLEGPYLPEHNRGAYCVAFPPKVGDDRIDLFHSPYIQNCTNQSGPWLKDGSMFLPDGTVQVPKVVGTSTWDIGTATIVVYPSGLGIPEVGMYINSGQQNPGFFNARTLLLANKPFLQEQVVEFVDQAFNSNFTYNSATCARDIGLIVDGLATDLLYQSTSESTFSGLQYWSQESYTGAIPSEITATIAAIGYVKGLVQGIAGAYDTVVGDDFDVILNILNNGVSGVTDIMVSNGAPSTDPQIISAYNTIINAIPSIQTSTINWINSNYPSLTYNQDTCRRDVGYMIRSVAFDLLNPNFLSPANRQAIKAGVYYYAYGSTTVITNNDLPGNNEIPQTTAAYNFIKSIIPNIITGTALPSTYQTSVTQVLPVAQQTGTSHEVTKVKNEIDIITDIIRNGPSVAGSKTPILTSASTSSVVVNAFNLLASNREFIKAETIAYINTALRNFTYSKEKCFRDVGILVENVSYDAVFGGNEKSVQSGLAYYNGVISRINGQETQTVSAIDYLHQLCNQIVINNTCTNLKSTPAYTQVINTALTGGEIILDSMKSNFEVITSIIENGPSVAPDIILGQGPDAAYMSAEILMQANRTFIQQQTINYINWNLAGKSFPYSQIKCSRDVGIIIDSVASDIRYPSSGTNPYVASTFAGLQYWNQNGYTGLIYQEINQTIDAVTYLKELSAKIIKNVTVEDDASVGIVRYYTGGVPQAFITNIIDGEPVKVTASDDEVAILNKEFDIIISILKGDTQGWTDAIIANGEVNNQVLESRKNAYNLLKANVAYMAEEIIAYINATNPGFSGQYNQTTCRRDVGYIINSVGFDLLTDGNRQAIMAGLSYYTYTGGTSNIPTEITQTNSAFQYLSLILKQVVENTLISDPLQDTVKQVVYDTAPDATSANSIITNSIDALCDIIANGPATAGELSPVINYSTDVDLETQYKLISDNKAFLIAEIIAFIDTTYNAGAFNYNESLCYRDTGLIVDAVSQDILLGGNSKSIEAGLSYWNQGYNYVSGQVTTTTLAINYARDIALQIAANQPVSVITGTTVAQVINSFFQYGEDYMPQQAISRNFGIITTIIENGPLYAPPVYQGSGLFSATGQLADDVKISAKVTSVNSSTISGAYVVGLNTTTVGFAHNATLYFGDVSVFPLNDTQVEALSLEYTGNTSTWNSRKLDPIGAMGGSLVDGAVISDRSPIQSFVYDAFTQVPQGGRGIHITNNGYAQLVSVFTIFCSVGVQVDNGGIASIVNSNANFGDICLLAKGYGKRAFSGTIYNPPYVAYPNDPDFNSYYPNGFWPNSGNIQVFVPDVIDRPHISLVMEIEPDEGHINEQGFPGFLNATPSLATLTTGTITITGIDTLGIAVGNTVYVRNEDGKTTGTNGILYADTGTIVTDIGYQSITLNKALTNGGGDPTNPNYFTLYFCGNSYYTVLSSTVADNPRVNGTNILSLYNTSTDQVSAHVDAITYLNTLTDLVIGNTTITGLYSTATQVKLPLVTGGEEAKSFIDLRFGDMIKIISTATLADVESAYPQSSRNKTGVVPSGAGSAVTLIEANMDFLATEVGAYVVGNYSSSQSSFSYNETLCRRDTGLIVDAITQDLLFGGTSQSTFAAIQYWNQTGHVGLVGSELTTTTAAINHVSLLAQDIIKGTSTVTRYQSAVSQVTSSTYATSSEASKISADFGVITTILNASTLEGLTDTIVPNSITASTNSNVNIAFNLLQSNKAYIQAEAIAFITNQYPSFSYDTNTCYRDVGYMIDSVCVDLLYSGNRQAFQSGVYYWSYSTTSSRIPTEIPETITAYKHISNIVSEIIKGIAITPSAGNSETQVLPVLPQNIGTESEVLALRSKVDIITNIIANGPSGVVKTAINPIASTNQNIIHAATLLEANRTFIQAEIIAFINDTFSNHSFEFNQDKCKRDVKLILQRLIYDIESGGRYNSIMNGLSYWSRNGTHHIVSLGENVRRNDLFPDGCTVNFYQRSYISASGYVFEYVGAGTNYGALPQVGYADPVQSKETVQLDSGKVFFTSTDQNGDFRIGPGLVISQATGVLSGRTFTKSLFANMTPFILAIEGGS